MPEAGADPALVAAWLAARSISRGLPLPVPDHGGLRVETRSDTESRRHVFARPAPGLADLGRAIDDPLAVLKLCAPPELMAHLLPSRWSVERTGSLMTCDSLMPLRPVPAGYRLDLRPDSGAVRGLIRAADNMVAASGHAVERDGVFAFDRIVTEGPHRRRGLGAALMVGLAGARADPASRFVLVATAEGRALYESLGWQVLTPYSTARLG
ncbi:N-acetyltransferase [Sphingomonas sp. MAH-20]|uniref:N-acetyltransferase n=1 Tax=Sphingomonas horti TaxID=2682842 RepID=A0A6I4J224_9SPHN|nr:MULTISPECIES: GNAT family N-acetyltransferase [Sphingomonas]MBA2919486.1 GNAT family N-acetyltransferase [Sphingomonas sp. CGMCC 1.13658]MVO78366.1 N-acetyltransferase [Sphingomonas horti]